MSAPTIQEQATARTLLELVDFHKAECGGDCTVSLVLMAPLYEKLIGRPLTADEVGRFM